MDTTGITPVMSVGNSDGGFGMGGWGGIIGLLAVLGLFNGGFGFGNNNNSGMDAVAAAIASTRNTGYTPQYATQQDVQFTSQFSQLLDGNRDLSNLITNGTAQTIAASTANATNAIAAIKDGNAALIREFGNVETALTALDGNMRNCCCDVKQQIMQNNYDGAMRDAATNANFTAQIQSVKDLISQNKIESLQAQINQLQLQNATSGLLRFPNEWTFTGGYFPPMQTAAAAG